MTRWARSYLLPLGAALAVLAGCAMHREAALRSALAARFHIGDQFFFDSRFSCTAAVYRATENVPKPDYPTASDPAEAQELYRQNAHAAVLAPNASAHDLTDAMLLNDDGAFGKQALAAAAQVEKCLTPEIRRDFRKALTRKGSMLAYDAELNGVVVIDSLERKLFFAAGDSY